jgi:hypothetical protein
MRFGPKLSGEIKDPPTIRAADDSFITAGAAMGISTADRFVRLVRSALVYQDATAREICCRAPSRRQGAASFAAKRARMVRPVDRRSSRANMGAVGLTVNLGRCKIQIGPPGVKQASTKIFIEWLDRESHSGGAISSCRSRKDYTPPGLPPRPTFVNPETGEAAN